MAVGMDFLDIHTCAYRKVGYKYDVAELIAVCGFNECILGDYLTVSGSHILGCIESELYICDFTIRADIKDIVMFHCLFKVNDNLLSLVGEGCRGTCDFDMLSGIYEFYIYRLFVDNHTVGCFNFTDFIFAEIERLGCSSSVFTSGNGCDYLTFSVSDCSVKSNYILNGDYFVNRTFQAFDFIYRLIDTVLFGYRGEDLTELRNGDCSFLCVVLFNYSYKVGRAVNLKGNGSAVENISVAGVLLNDFIVSVRQCIRKHKFSGGIGVIDFDIHWCRIVDMLNYIFACVGVANLKANAGCRDNFACFGILFHDFDFSFKGCIVDKVTVCFAVLIDADIEGSHKLFAFKTFGLLYSIYTVRQPVGSFSEAVFISFE